VARPRARAGCGDDKRVAATEKPRTDDAWRKSFRDDGETTAALAFSWSCDGETTEPRSEGLKALAAVRKAKERATNFML
jgi:hypothetical protein